MVYLWGQVGTTKEFLIGGGDSLRWQNNEWHLWVMNWRAASVEFSLDGGLPHRANTPMPFATEWDGTGHSHFLLGAQDSSAPYLLDEVIVLNRPLSQEEIQWIYEQAIEPKN